MILFQNIHIKILIIRVSILSTSLMSLEDDYQRVQMSLKTEIIFILQNIHLFSKPIIFIAC